MSAHYLCLRIGLRPSLNEAMTDPTHVHTPECHGNDATHSLSTHTVQHPTIRVVATYDKHLQRRLRQMGQRVREQRMNLGLSQEELAHRAGLHRTYVGSVERGERNISVGSLYTLADILGTHPTTLLPE